jgi:hypothetical protein
MMVQLAFENGSFFKQAFLLGGISFKRFNGDYSSE